jgi:hypothetical protein
MEMEIGSRSEMVLESLALFRRLKWTAERFAARVQFTLQGKKRLAPLSEEQLRQFHNDGYLLIRELIPENLVSRAETAMWHTLEADAHSPDTWTRLGPRPHVIRDARLTEIYTDHCLAAAAQLAGEDVSGFRRPTHAFTINNVPVTRDWQAHWPHIDQTLAAMRIRTFPRPYSIAAMIYLTDVKSHGGGTIVFPGSHVKLEALARTDPGKYKYLSALNADLGEVDLGIPVELTPSRGDVLFYHYLCAHSSSDNVSTAPRLAIGHKW